jgi:dihydrodipicolinate synthase/N-acetylneuraminate lyase
LRGLCGGTPRPPLQPLGEAEIADVRAELDRAVHTGLIKAVSL